MWPGLSPSLCPSLRPSLQDGAEGQRAEASEAPLISDPFYNSQLSALKSQPDSSGIPLPRLTIGRGMVKAKQCVGPLSLCTESRAICLSQAGQSEQKIKD